MLPRPPGFESCAPHVVHARSGFRIWFTEPLGILTQLGDQTIADEHMGAVLTGPVTDKLFELRGSTPTKLSFTHEWSRMEGYTTKVRGDLTSWGIELRKDIDRLTVVLAPTTKQLVRMGIDVAGVGLRLAGVSLDVAYDIAVIRELGLRPHPVVRGSLEL